MSVRTHLIAVIIDKLLAVDWDTGKPQEPEPEPGNQTVLSRLFGMQKTSDWLFGASKGRTPEGDVPEAVEERANGRQPGERAERLDEPPRSWRSARREWRTEGVALP